MAFDPGATTGVAILSNDTWSTYQLPLKTYPHPHKALYDHISEVKPTTIVYEAFLHRQGQTGAQYTGVECIGVILLWAQQNQVTAHSITPSHGKAFWTNEKLKALGIYKTGQPHGMDAVRVLMTHLSKTDKQWMKEVVGKLHEMK
jgi:hypothetical protein